MEGLSREDQIATVNAQQPPEALARIAPNGIQWEQWRRSENVEDTRDQGRLLDAFDQVGGLSKEELKSMDRLFEKIKKKK